MPLQKQEFYEGAALHGLARSGKLDAVRLVPPFFRLNGAVSVLLKYSTRGRSPWGFTFTADEQSALVCETAKTKTYIGLICGADGVTAIDFDAYASIAMPKLTAIRVSCFRDHGEHYGVRGPDGVLERKIAPSAWQRILG